MEAPPINQDQMEQLLGWLDGIPFSRPKKNLSRDFSDGVLVSEIMKHYYPKLVHLHNYTNASALNAKYNNWKILNQKVFRKLKFGVLGSDVENVIKIEPGYIERVLFMIYTNIRNFKRQKTHQSIDYDHTKFKDEYRQLSTKQNLQVMTQLAERQDAIIELRGAIDMLQIKLRQMQELSRLKDDKIQTLIRKLEQGIN